MKVAVYCGSKLGTSNLILDQSKKLGKILALKSIELIYGGGSTGIMGIVADSVLEHGGQVTGDMPKGLFHREKLHGGLTTIIETKDMHERKMTMFELADAFVIMPGGVGTMDEFFEILTWKEIKIHQKRIILVNIDQYYSALINQFKSMKSFGFTNPFDFVDVVSSVEEVFEE